jgi:hypothetical protein
MAGKAGKAGKAGRAGKVRSEKQGENISQDCPMELTRSFLTQEMAYNMHAFLLLPRLHGEEEAPRNDVIICGMSSQTDDNKHYSNYQHVTST